MAKNPTAKSFGDLFGSERAAGNDPKNGAAETPADGPAAPAPAPGSGEEGNAAQRPAHARAGGAAPTRPTRTRNTTRTEQPKPAQTGEPVASAPADEREQEHLLKRWDGELSRTGLAVRAAERQLDERRDAWERNVRDFRKDAAERGIPEQLVERTILMASLRAEDLPIPKR